MFIGNEIASLREKISESGDMNIKSNYSY